MKKRYFVIGVIIVAVATAGVWSFPLWHTAYLLQNLAKSESLECQIQVTLNQEGLFKGQKQLLHLLSRILKTEETDCLNWQAVGYTAGRKGYVRIYCDVLQEPVTEIYFSKDDTLVNVRMLYEVLQRNFVKEYPILGYMLPEWKYGTYISLDQVQDIFQVDIKEIFQQNSFGNLTGQGFWKSLILLNRMERHRTKEGGWKFETVWNDYHTVLLIEREKQETGFKIEGTDREKTQKIAEFSFSLSPGEEEAVIFPESLMKTEEIAQFQKLWQALSEFTEGR